MAMCAADTELHRSAVICTLGFQEDPRGLSHSLDPTKQGPETTPRDMHSQFTFKSRSIQQVVTIIKQEIDVKGAVSI